MILFVDNIADLIEVSNTTVVILEREHGLMDVIRWIEGNRFHLQNFDIISFMIGRADLVRSKNWFSATVDELLAVIMQRNDTALYLLGALIPCITDSCGTVRDIVARNAIIQKKCLGISKFRKMEYTRPGKVLLCKGGPVPKFFGQDTRLNEEGRKLFAQAIQDKRVSANLDRRALAMRRQGSVLTQCQ